MAMRDITLFLNQLKQWIAGQPDILAALLVGSFARGTARDDSDIDLVFITNNPDLYLKNDAWLDTFGTVSKLEDEDWGLLQSRRVFYDNGLEVEFGITTRQWAAIDPVDAGTRRVVSDGAQIVSDPSGMLQSLINA